MSTYEELFTEEAIRQMADSGISVPSKESMTCSKCSESGTCEFAWDLYNTDGDCLASK